MNKLNVRKATKEDISLLFDFINHLALYERRPWDMTGTKEDLEYWLFEKNIASSFIAELDGSPIGYAIYYPIFGSFSAKGKVHLEDIFINEEHRKKGHGKEFFAKVASFALQEGFTGMEWSCLDWNASSINFYNKINANEEIGRVYFEFTKQQMENISK